MNGKPITTDQIEILTTKLGVKKENIPQTLEAASEMISRLLLKISEQRQKPVEGQAMETFIAPLPVTDKQYIYLKRLGCSLARSELSKKAASALITAKLELAKMAAKNVQTVQDNTLDSEKVPAKDEEKEMEINN